MLPTGSPVQSSPTTTGSWGYAPQPPTTTAPISKPISSTKAAFPHPWPRCISRLRHPTHPSPPTSPAPSSWARYPPRTPTPGNSSPYPSQRPQAEADTISPNPSSRTRTLPSPPITPPRHVSSTRAAWLSRSRTHTTTLSFSPAPDSRITKISLSTHRTAKIYPAISRSILSLPERAMHR